MRFRKRFIFTCVIGMGLLMGLTTKAFPYAWWEFLGTPYHWKSGTATMDLHPVSFQPGPWTDNMISAMQNWNNVLVSPFTYNWRIQARDINNHADGYNAVAWVSNNCDGWLGVTYVRTRSSSSELKDTDIWFDVDCPGWVSSSPNREIDVAAPAVSFRKTAQHELGHALGLNHEFSAVAIMNYGRIFERIQGDDKNGLRFLYPGSGTDVDLSVTNAVSDGSGEMRYVYPPSRFFPQQALPGATIQVEYTIQNMGNVPANGVGVGFYLGSYFLGRSYFDFPVHSIGTFTRTLTIPPTIPPGDYLLYVYIDDMNTVIENDESNNRFQNPWGALHIHPLPSIPGQPVASPESPNQGTFTLNWAPSNGVHLIDHYTVFDQYRIGTQSFINAFNTFDTRGTSYYFENLPIATHTFWIQAVDEVGLGSSPSPTTNVVVTQVEPPGQPVANPPSPNQGRFTLSWVPGYSVHPISHYLLYEDYTITINNSTVTTTITYNVFETSFDFSNLPATTYTFWVKAVDGFGQESDPSPTTAVIVTPPSGGGGKQQLSPD